MSLPQKVDRGKTNCSPAPEYRRSTTLCTTLTGAGRSAIAVIGVRGADACAMVARYFRSASKRRVSQNEIRYGVWAGPQTETVPGESIVVTPLADDHIEIHCHGGPAATKRIMEDLQNCGAARIQSDDWTLGKKLLAADEAEQVLARCLTAKTAAIAMDQVRGAMVKWATRLLKTLEQESSSIAAAHRQAEEILECARFTTRLAEPFWVVLIGPPNVGKSSLLNAIVGFDRSITLDAAGTTRDVLHAETVIDGLPIRISDTAGIHDSDRPIEQQGMARARIAADQADLVLGIAEPNRVGHLDNAPRLLHACGERLIRVMNKSDLLENRGDHDTFDLATNALTGEGVEELMKAIADNLAAAIPKPGAPVAINQRQAGLLREVMTVNSRELITEKLRELLGARDVSGQLR